MRTFRSPRALNRILAAALLMFGAASPALAAGTGYQAQGGRLYDAAGQEIQLRGVSHFGFNADILQPQYLWSMGWKEQIAQIKSLGFNAVRVPFVPDTLYVTTPVDKLSWVDPDKNADLLGKTPLQVLDLWMAEANRQGLYILLDFHSVAKARQYPTWFVDNPADFGITWNGQAYTEDQWVRDLKFVAQRYAGLSRFIGIDLYNEPNGKVRWSTGDPNMTESKYYWKPAVEKAAAGILQVNPNLLIFVQGITPNWDGVENSNVPMNWGENFQPQAYQPLNVAAGKLVLSPHTYGPDVYVKSSFGAANFPANLAADWDTLFGKFSSQVPVVVGEWGGRYGQGGVGQADVTWQNAFVDYLVAKNIRSSFYWCYTPNSGDTGGILTDALEVRQDKMTLLKRHWGSPPTSTTPPATTDTTSPSTSPGTLAFSASAYDVLQGAGSITIAVARTGGTKGAVSVAYSTAGATARSPHQYKGRSGTLGWVAGDTAPKSFTVSINNTTPFTGTKYFTVNLAKVAGGAVLGTPKTATVTITGSQGATAAPPSSSPPPPTSSPTYARPYIASFAPTSGPVGTVVTLNGSGFTGLTSAWVGSSHDAAFAVTSDTQVNVTIPANATSGAIGLLNPSYASFTPSSYTVTAGSAPPPATQPPYPQPQISGFAPASGGVGTVITVTGGGFNGVNAAWVGNGRDAAVTVVSDTQARVTVPASASSGVVKLLNPSYSATSSASFTLTTTAPPPSTGLSLRVQGNRFVNGAGNVVQLRGVNYSGFEFAAIQGWSGTDPSGGQAGQPGGPKWSALQSWKANALRIPLNEASWQNRTCTDTSGVVRDADPADNYQAAVREQVRQANAVGLYVILDLHWSAPGNTCPMLQTQMANADHSLAFWTSVANTFKNNPAVVFELFNEPFMNFGFSGDTWTYMMKGTNGSFSSYPATSGSGNWQQVQKSWAIASYQAMLDAVRATGATNVILVGTMQYAQDLSGWLMHRPTDPLNQMGAAWHPYQKYQSAWDYPYPNFHPEVMTDAKNILAAGIPMVMTEVGGRNAPGTPSSPIVTTMTDFADANGIGVLGWTWGVWGETEHVLIKDVNGTPTDGYGVVYRNWMLAH